MTSPRDHNSNIKDGDNNNLEMHMTVQLLETQTKLNQVTTQFLANNHNNTELDPAMLKFLESQSQLLQRMTNQMINMVNNPSQRNYENNDF